MQFLEEGEISLLHSILVNHILIAHEVARSDMLINCGLPLLPSTLFSLRSSAAIFVNELCAKLSLAQTTARPSRQHGLVALLNYITKPPYDADLSLEEKRFLERVKQKCQQWYEPQIHKQYSTLQVLDQELRRWEQISSEPVQASVKIDWKEIIVNYDLYSFMPEFVNRVNYGKASAFTIGGDFNVLRDYIVERMRQELKKKMPGPQILLDISLDPSDIAEDESILEKKVVSRNKCDKLTDLFRKYPKTHIVLVVWCYASPSQQLASMAMHFWQEVQKSVLPLLREWNRCFVFILANVDLEGKPYQIDNFTTLQLPMKFELADLLPWFQGRLDDLGIEQSDVELCLERLKDQHGDFVRTYREMEYIVNYLQEKYGYAGYL